MEDSSKNILPLEDSDSSINIFNIFIYIIIILIAVLITVGNFIVILAMILEKSLRTPPNIYLGSLAVIDLSVGIFVLPLRIIEVFNDNFWQFGRTMCGIYITLDVTLCTLSIYHLIAIAVDRYRAITQGLRYVQQRSFTSVTATISFLWVLSLWISTPPALGWQNDDWGMQPLQIKNDTHFVCTFTRNHGYVFHSALGTFILPMTIVTVLYIRIYSEIKARLRKKARPASMHAHSTNEKKAEETSESCSSEDILEMENERKSQKFKNRIHSSLTKLRQNISSTTGFNKEGTSSSSNETSDQSSNRSKNTVRIIVPRPSTQFQAFVRKKIKFSMSKERRAVKTLGVITGAFMISWSPFCIIYLLDAFYFPLRDTFWFEMSTWLAYVNSLINPIIYCWFNRDFRNAFFKMLCYHKCVQVE